MQDYQVRISGDLECAILYYGNSDQGPFGLHNVLQSARVIETRFLRGFSLGQCLRTLIADHPPNQWGLT